MKQPSASRSRQKPTTTTATPPLPRKLRFVCSFNGAFHLRPPSNSLKYIGGEARIVSVDRNITFSNLRSKISDLCPKLLSFSLKYQLSLPGRDRDSHAYAPLRSVSSDEDVRRMIKEYEMLELYGKKIRLWIFVNDNDSDNKADKIAISIISNAFGSEIAHLFGDLGLKSRSQQFKDDKVKKNQLSSGDDSLVLKQKSFTKQSSEGIDFNCTSELIELTNCCEENKQKNDEASEPLEYMYQGNIPDAQLNPRDGNLQDNKNFQVFCKEKSMCDYESMQDLGIIEHGRTSSGVSHFGNSKSIHYQLACDNAVAAVESPSSCMEKMESQVDFLTGSPYQSHQSVCKNYNAVSSNSLSNHLSSNNAVPENGIRHWGSGVFSPVDLVDDLSLSTTNGEPHDLSVSLIKPETSLSDLIEGELIILHKADKAVASNSSASNAASTQKDQVRDEEIQQNLLSDLCTDKDSTKQSIKGSKAIGEISTDLVALYNHLATRHLQTIKNSDLEYLKELGSGTYGTVYHGKWKGSDVAIKKIKPSCFTGGSQKEDRLVADFWKEAHILGQLHHPNIVAFYGVVTDGPANNLATVTEYMVNGSLKQVLERKDRTIDRRKRVILAMDAAFGMEYLHEKNIVHFDLKSHNFLVNMKDPKRPVCKIGDLGLSKIKQRTLVSGGVRGTIPWMAPELLDSKNKMVTEKVDVFSFGIVMWELLTGEEPYSNLRSEEIIGGIMKGSLRPEIPSWCDPRWRSLMERCWSSDPDCRPSFSDIAKELRTMNIK